MVAKILGSSMELDQVKNRTQVPRISDVAKNWGYLKGRNGGLWECVNH